MYPTTRREGQIQFGLHSATELAEQYGTPLYIYDEATLRERCRQVKNICTLPNFKVYYSAKANSNIALLKIIRQEGLLVDAMTLGEVFQEKLAGFQKDEILFLSNNVSKEDFKKVIHEDLQVCVDSLTQLDRYCSLNPNRKGVIIRLNPGKGAGHHEKVVTAGKVKFGIELDLIDEAMAIAKKHKCKVTGFQIHIGSLFLDAGPYLEAIANLLDVAEKYPQIEYIDFGGGLGTPYDRPKEKPFPLQEFSEKFTELLTNWMEKTGRTPTFAIEPGRFLVAESGSTMIQVHSTKTNMGIRFVGTNLGFNFLLRPELYEGFHEIMHATSDDHSEEEVVTVVGNVCESGDRLGENRTLPKIEVGDLLLVRDTGAYGFAMASNYNSMLRPAEVLIKMTGEVVQIRKRENPDDLIKNQIF